MRIKDMDVTRAHTRLAFFPLVCRQTYTHTLTHTHTHKRRHTRMHGHTQACMQVSTDTQARAQIRAPQETETLLRFSSH